MKKTEFGFSMPAANPLYPGPPWFFRGHSLTILYESDPKVLREMLPEPLEPDARNLVTIDAQYMPWSFPLGPCSESGVYIAARYKDKAGSYCPFMFMDSDASIAAGREVYGYPKKLAKISLCFGGHPLNSMTPDIGPVGGEIMTGVVSRCGISLLKISAALIEKGRTDEFLPGFPLGGNHINLRVIPNVDGKPLIRQLTLVEYRAPEDFKVTEAWRGPATISFEESPSDPVYKLRPVRILGAVYQRCEITLRAGEVLHTYT